MSRGVHYSPPLGSDDYHQGQGQAEISTERYYILCALLKKQYTLRECAMPLVPEDIDHEDGEAYVDLRVGPYYNVVIDVSPYLKKPVKVKAVKYSPCDNGTIRPKELADSVEFFRDHWKMQEGGVMYALVCYEGFLPCIWNYHSPQKTSGIKNWDKLFSKLVAKDYPKGIIPCMFFGRPSGCLDGACPFLHDLQAVIESRTNVLVKRAITFEDRITHRQLNARRDLLMDCVKRGFNAQTRRMALLDPDAWLDVQMKGDVAYCANPECMETWKDFQKISPLKQCSKCKWAMYCSMNCQKKDWKRHKREPCATVEEMIENDELWDIRGKRKGTQVYGFIWS